MTLAIMFLAAVAFLASTLVIGVQISKGKDILSIDDDIFPDDFVAIDADPVKKVKVPKMSAPLSAAKPKSKTKTKK